MVEIITPRLRLRRAGPEDLQAMHAILSNDRAALYWSTPPHRNLEQSREWLNRMIEAPADSSDDFIVEYRGQCIGKAGMYQIPEIGYVLHPDYWGLGLAGEAVAAVVKRAFEVLAIPAVIADADPRNEPSLRLLKRLGFRETGREANSCRIGGRWCDSVYLALSRADVDENRSGPSGATASD